MKIFEILDEEENKKLIGTLLYYEKEKTFICELSDGLDEWDAPFHFSSFVRDGIYTIPRDETLNWVRSRIIPPSRQNIDYILKNHKLKEYDEGIFLETSRGKCSQDSLYIRPIKELPGYVVKRQQKNVKGVSLLTGRSVLCSFADGKLMKVELAKLSELKRIGGDVKKVLKIDDLFASCKPGTGGYFITFNDSIDIPAGVLYENGEVLPLSSEDLRIMVKSSLIDTSEVCELLDCSRQNLSYMIGKGFLTPVMEGMKGNIFIKDDVIKNMW